MRSKERSRDVQGQSARHAGPDWPWMFAFVRQSGRLGCDDDDISSDVGYRDLSEILATSIDDPSLEDGDAMTNCPRRLLV